MSKNIEDEAKKVRKEHKKITKEFSDTINDVITDYADSRLKNQRRSMPNSSEPEEVIYKKLKSHGTDIELNKIDRLGDGDQSELRKHSDGQVYIYIYILSEPTPPNLLP